MRSLLISLALLCCACPEPDSVDLGAECKEAVECKPPGDTCAFAVGLKRCTNVCNAEQTCPDTFVCARMDVAVREADGQKWTGERGYCLPEAEVPPRAAKIRPAKQKKKSRKKRRKK